MSLKAILGPGGLIADRLPGYEPRPQQLEMAQAIERAMRAPGHLLVEAGTGVGKSFAYLVPAIQACQANKDHRVVVSTKTIALQEQLIGKDLPFLNRVLPDPVPAALVKGRSNYVSLRRLAVARQHAPKLFLGYGPQQELERIAVWARGRKEGSKSELPFPPSHAAWAEVESDRGNCLGRKCPTYDRCFYFQARRSMESAQLLIVNHALFFSDLAMRASENGIGFLPDYHTAILDEAHAVEDVAAQHLGLRWTSSTVEYHLNRLFSPRSDRGLLTVNGTPQAIAAVAEARQALAEFAEQIHTWRTRELDRHGKGEGRPLRVREPGIVRENLSEALEQMAKALGQAANTVLREEENIELLAAANRCDELALGLRNWMVQALAGQVYWLDLQVKQRTVNILLQAAPMDVGPVLRERLFGGVPSVILTSATLSTGGADGFGHVRSRLGLDACTTLQLGSPFNYPEQAELHLFRAMPDPNKEQGTFEAAAAGQIRDYALANRGRTLVLFTSVEQMRRLAERLEPVLLGSGIELLCQGEKLSNKQLLEQFLKRPAAVLFGVESFWQGVDVPGEALVAVIIVKLPFAPPDEPLFEARCEVIRRDGGSDFLEYQLPGAIIKLKQGFGRLIRTRQDRGLVAILDPRMVTKSYGRTFLQALPECPVFVDGEQND